MKKNQMEILELKIISKKKQKKTPKKQKNFSR